ncbi:MAG: type II CAAX endopeptidase family protein, partial [Gemmatimonas sp.]
LYAKPGRLRAVWRLAAFALALMVFQPIAESIMAPAFGVLSRAVGEPIAAYPWITLVSVFASLALTVRVIDEAPWQAVGMDRDAWRIRTLGRGLVLGSAAILATSALLWLTRGLRFETVVSAFDDVSTAPNAWIATALRITLLLAPAALWEEMLFRGYLWTVAEDAGGVRVARWATAIAFGLVHVLNPGASVLSTTIVTLAGFCLGAVRERTGSLAAAWLAHLAWNWIMAAALHVPVSGAVFDTPGYRATLVGADWWTGGTWGPEGGVAALLVIGGALLLSIRPTEWRSFRMRTGSR